MGRTRIPRKRPDLIQVELEDEIVLYDPRRGHSHALNATAASMWRRLRQEISPDDVSARLAVRMFARRGLLDGPLPVERDGLSRRTMLRRLALAGAAIPAIQTVKTQGLLPVSAMSCSQPGCGSVCPGNRCCACASTREGTNVCVQPVCPFPQTSCASSGECPPGMVCVTGIISVCCEILGSFCMPLCTPGFTAGFCTRAQRAGETWNATSPSWKVQ